MVVEWVDSFSLGIPEIDTEHRHLVELLTGAQRFANLGENYHDDICHFLDMFEMQTAEHFRHEEDLMAEYGYGSLADHKFQHKMFLAETNSIAYQIRHNHQHTEKLLAFLTACFLHHLLGDDHKLADEVKAQ